MTKLKAIGPDRFRPTQWLKSAGYAPQVFIFRNLESGQVLYSQLPNFSEKQIKLQFQRPNWANKQPSARRDIWKCMCVVDMPSYEASVQLYQNLVRLRYLRDVTYVKQTNEMRKKNNDGNVWFSGQYRPTYTQEAVADLVESLTKIDSEDKKLTIHWEDQWRMGDKEKYWTPILPQVEHSLMSRVGNTSREESSILKELGERAKEAFSKGNVEKSSSV
ncbi:hypothetical protein Kpol_1004p73 [Vanderwaltozyma polyspora DSM 70294]|uniref:Large ribosomal subunit protein mL67 n=1 Tax=Vanderwaltozyma polyspora (strain ATCC 22028 / DSM 70294 / BCRC 21397 / CBS 2163 / NBRC 10782 / NRRL Y-8283 / UCD 57-17) TaxID=436907 RepID=A7TJC6_VANPO|nr:uncharacterized protein Kpol_1004p73 [Vanderwaltozyma polyspora DSM 70294]EDO17695.1 hypothetical protein Kpol_1004p73 [Vanderwaltozyma polyspora DSM 70294]